MSKLEWANCTVTLGELKPWADNPRFSTKAQAERLIKSFDELGQFQTIAISPTNEVYDGHQRLSALLTVHGGDFEIDARQSNRPLTEAERRRMVFAANVQAGNWDADKLASWDAPQVLDWAGVDASAWQNQKREVAMWGEMLTSEIDEEEAFGKLPDEDRAPFQQMTFTLHDEQAEIVRRAIKLAQSMGVFGETGNENSNGNALARICEVFITQNDNG